MDRTKSQWESKKTRKAGKKPSYVQIYSDTLQIEIKQAVLANSFADVPCSYPLRSCVGEGKLVWEVLRGLSERNSSDDDGTIPWVQILKVIDSRWFEITGRYLHDEQKEYLRLKLVGESSSSENITYEELFKASPSKSRKFSFWHWAQEALNAAEKSVLKDLAKGGVFAGFMERQRAHTVLKSAPNEGAFIVRFSDSLPGHVAIHFRGSLDSPVRSIDPQDFNPSHADFGRKLNQFLANESLLKFVYCASRESFSWEAKKSHFMANPDRKITKGYDLRPFCYIV